MYHVCIDSISYQSPTRCQGKAGRADSLNNSSSLVHTYPTFPFSITYASGLLLMRTHGFVNRCHRSSFVLQKSRQQSVHFQLTQSHDSINTGEPVTSHTKRSLGGGANSASEKPLRAATALIPLVACKYLTSIVRSPSRSSSRTHCWLTSTISATSPIAEKSCPAMSINVEIGHASHTSGKFRAVRCLTSTKWRTIFNVNLRLCCLFVSLNGS